MKAKFHQAVIMGLCLYSATTGAVPWDKPTDAEVAVLPPYCLAKFRGVAIKQWEKIIGPIYLDVHHYCGAMVFLSRYYKSRDKQDRGFYLKEVNDNLDYMIKADVHKPSNSSLMPEIYYTKGKVLVLSGKNAEAVGVFLQAIKLKPDYAAPYVAIADFYVQTEKKQDALKILQEGLRQLPKSKSLARRYQELGGKLPLSESILPMAETPPPEAQPPVPLEAEKKVTEVSPFAAPENPRPEQAPPSGRIQDKIGSPSNPWCRFCVDDELTPARK